MRNNDENTIFFNHIRDNFFHSLSLLHKSANHEETIS